MIRSAARSVASFICLLVSVAAANTSSADDKLDFNRDVRPILSETCFQCHGPDKNQRQAELRLDTKGGLFDAREGHHPIVAGKPKQSELLRRITSEHPDERMPPADAKRKLTKQQIDIIRKWIEQGAEWKGHWSYISLSKPDAPTDHELANSGYPKFVRNAVDRFILAKLKERRLKPSAAADRVTLIRRLSIDLTGLPPSIKQVEDFVNDNSERAYEKLVDRLLSSQQYGERMAMYWLDLVRYADTNGIHGDNHREVSLFRDYVITSFNKNIPFDRFTIEQLAGDLFSEPNNDQKVASGYNRILMTTREGGAQAKEYLAKYAADRVRNASAVWMGSTMGCCECHDHKFDPFTTKDFYGFASFFADIQETAVGVQAPSKIPSAADSATLKKLDAEIARLKNALNTQTDELDTAQSKWEDEQRAELAAHPNVWTAIVPKSSTSSSGTTLTTQKDKSVLASGKNPNKDTYTVTLQTDQQNITGIRLEALVHPSLAGGKLSRANGNFVLTSFEVDVTPADSEKSTPVEIGSAAADFEQKKFSIKFAIDKDAASGWAVEGWTRKENRAAVFTLKKPIVGGKGTTLTVRMKHESVHAKHNIGRFRLSATSVEKPPLEGNSIKIPDAIVKVLETDPEKRSKEQTIAIATHYRGIAPALNSVRGQLGKTQKQRDADAKAIPTTLIATSIKPRMMRVLPRGNWLDDSGEVVQPAVPQFLATLKVDGRGTRLDLAKWFVAKDNPLVARVFVNRLWKICFGQGIVSSLDDFGAQGTWPSHPELLDWLAIEFIDSGWDVKHMLRLMVMSGAYRQSSAANNESHEADPFNKWLARQGRFRFEAETVRDNALEISGLLVKKIGGRSVKPYQPAGYWVHLNFPKRTYKHDIGESQYRRGLYTYWCRTFLHPSLRAFDASTREECEVQRPRSNTPLQALVLLNDPTYVESARAFAERIIRESGHGDSAKQVIRDRINHAFRLALSRSARPKELDVLTPLFQKHFDEYQIDKVAAEEFLKVALRPAPTDINPAELAAWTSVARVILNLHETITRY